MSKLGDYFHPSSHHPERSSLAAVDAADGDPRARGKSSSKPKWEWMKLVRASDCPLTAMQRSIARVMAEPVDDSLTCWLSVGSIADGVGCSERHLQRELPKIVAAGYLSPAGKHPKYRTNMYKLAFPEGVTPCHVGGDGVSRKGDTVSAERDTVSPDLPGGELDLHQSKRAVAALVEKSLEETAGDHPSSAGEVATSTPALTAAEQPTGCEQLFATLPLHEQDERTWKTLRGLTAGWSTHELEQAREDLVVAVAKHDADEVPIRSQRKFLCSILKRMCVEKAVRERNREEAA